MKSVVAGDEIDFALSQKEVSADLSNTSNLIML